MTDKRWIVGRSIESARKDLRLSQLDLAKKVGVHQSLISSWESGRHSPKPLYLRRLVETLGAEIIETTKS